MTKIAIVYHSGYGHTKKQAEAVSEGVKHGDATPELIAIDAEGNLTEAQWAELDAADGIIFGSPTYMGNASWQFKKFADTSSKKWFTGAWKDKVAGGFTNSASLNGDKHSTIAYFMTFAMQHSMIWVGTGMMPANTKAATRNDINSLGGFSGALSSSPSDSSPEEAPTSGDLETAKQFGKRVAETARRFTK